LQNLWDAIEVYAAVLADYGKPGIRWPGASRETARIPGSGAGSGGRLDHSCARDHASRHRV